MSITRESLEKTLAQYIKETKALGQSNSITSKFNKIKILFLNLYIKNTLTILLKLLKRFAKIILFQMNLFSEIIQDLEIERLIITESEILLPLQNMQFPIMIRHGLQELELKVVIPFLLINYYLKEKIVCQRSM